MAGLYDALEHVRDPEMLRGLSPAERHVLLAIAIHVGKDGDASPSVHGVADITGYDRRSVIRIINRLHDKGRLIRRRGGGRGQRSRYVVPGPPWLGVIHNRDPETVIEGHRNDVTVTETVTETVTGGSPEEQEQGVVLTNRDSDSRATPPWIAQGITLRQWQQRERAAGRLRGYKQADHQ